MAETLTSEQLFGGGQGGDVVSTSDLFSKGNDMPFAGKYPNLYAGAKTAADMIPYLKYIDPEERDRFSKLAVNEQTRELLYENLNAVVGLALPAYGKAVSSVVAPLAERLLPKTFKMLTKDISLGAKAKPTVTEAAKTPTPIEPTIKTSAELGIETPKVTPEIVKSSEIFQSDKLPVKGAEPATKTVADDLITTVSREELRNKIDNIFGIDDNLFQRYWDGEVPDNILFRLDKRYGAALEHAALGKDSNAINKILSQINRFAKPEDYEAISALRRQFDDIPDALAPKEGEVFGAGRTSPTLPTREENLANPPTNARSIEAGALIARSKMLAESQAKAAPVIEKAPLEIATEARANALRNLENIRQTKPRSAAKRFGSNGPTPEQRAAYDAEVKNWNKQYRAANKAFKAADAEETKLTTPAPEPIPSDNLIAEVKGGATGELPKYAEGSAINLERLNTTDDVKQFINARTIEAEAKIGKRPVTWDETRAQAEALGWDTAAIKKEWNKKGAFSAAEIDATRQTNLNTISQLHDAIRNLPSDKTALTPEIRAQVLDAMDLIKTTSQAASEAGRALNIHKRILSNDPEFQATSEFNRVLKAITGKGVKRTDELINGLRDIDFNDPAAVNRFIYEATKTNWEKLNDRAFELWINGLLSNPLTHIVNTTSNAVTLTYSGAERQMAAGLEAGRALLAGDKRGLFFREGAENIFSISKGLQDGWKRFATVMRRGDTASKMDIPTSALPENIARFMPTRALATEDAFFKGFIESQELNRLAFRQARMEGLKGDALTKRITEILSSPSESIINIASEKGRYLTFQKELGEIGNLVLRARNVVPGLKYFIPFVKTPANIMKFSLERTPLNFPVIVTKAIKGELRGTALSEELAKPLMGSMLGVSAYILATQGGLTGGYPIEKTKREEWQSVGKLPYSVKVGDNYYSYARVEPLATIMGLSADFKQLQDSMTENEQYNVAAGIAGAISNNISDKTFMQGFSNLVEAVNDPGRYGKTFVKQLVGSLVPAVSGGITRSEDPYIRDARSILDTVKSRIPGLSETLPPKLTVWGDTIERTGSPAGRFLSPIQVSQGKGSPIEKEMAKLRLDIGYPDRKIKDVELSQDDYWNMVKDSGQKAKPVLDRLVSSSKWETLPVKVKEKAIASVVDQFRTAAREKLEAKLIQEGTIKPAAGWR